MVSPSEQDYFSTGFIFGRHQHNRALNISQQVAYKTGRRFFRIVHQRFPGINDQQIRINTFMFQFL